MAAPNQIRVSVLKYDGAEHRHWNATLLRQAGSLIVLGAEFEVDVKHNLLGNIGRGTRTIEYYWLDRWYNIFQFLEPDEATRLFYCNVNMPPEHSPGSLSYIDLDIDILVQPDLSYQVIDLEEFGANAARYGYPEDIKKRAHRAVAELISMIETSQFPFA